MQAPRVLPPELTIYTVGELVPETRAWITAAPELADDAGIPAERLQVDAAAVEEIDAAGLQLLLSLSNALQRQRRSLQLIGPSAALVAACEALGATCLLAGAAAREVAR